MSRIYTTIGIYSDGTYKVNGVSEEKLQEHIKYNQTYRFGRALLVDGQIVNLGYFQRETLEGLIQEKSLNKIKVQKDSCPYC